MNTDLEGTNYQTYEEILFWTEIAFLIKELTSFFFCLPCLLTLLDVALCFLSEPLIQPRKGMVEKGEEKHMLPFCYSSTASSHLLLLSPCIHFSLSLQCPVPSNSWDQLILILRVFALMVSLERPSVTTHFIAADLVTFHLPLCRCLFLLAC